VLDADAPETTMDSQPADSIGDTGDVEPMEVDSSHDAMCETIASSWTGWKDLPTPECCPLAAPDSLSSIVRTLTWHSCADAPSCEELDPESLGLSGSSALFHAGSSRSDGVPIWLELDYTADSGKVSQFAIFDWSTAAPFAAWRAYASYSGCSIGPIVGNRLVALLEITHPEIDKWLAVVDKSSPDSALSFQFVSGSEVPSIQDVALSDTTFAFDLPLAGRISRMPIASGKYVLSPASGYPAFLVGFAEGDDVFVESVHGSAGYGEEWRIDTDGAPAVIRSKAGRHISTFVTDGTTLFWVEVIGGTDIFATMPREVWAAPYSTDAAAIDATAKKVASIPDDRVPATAVAYGGIYAVISHAGAKTAYVVRASDGATTSVAAASSPTLWGFEEAVYVSNSELWVRTGAGALRRYALGSW
jgi:hypothetical protein